ncbi:cytochrome c oxidase subunit 3 [Paralimibaculum aggregatum]|uniref:cytochrome-c oxidase n=1 Tax=Paralimibaculum aggregatum TaxID=3036245 RepID=A0ABQ6LEQ5_9RHOB|nr:cytochrome c oxidase subunit 3 [Limibaculum sp. NKW23]GMG81825.1 cytochrome c oxidase subunit 3 [Limibaculum sp. NKW23]
MAHEKNHDYHILEPSPLPLLGAIGALIMLSGAVLLFHDVTPWVFVLGFLVVGYTMYSWWSEMVREAHQGDHTPVVRIGLRMGFILFVISEVMFFSAWFWSFFKHAIFPMVGDIGDLTMATADAPDGVWPPVGITTFDPWNLPLINTLILLLSGCTVTWAHHALIEGKRPPLLYGLLATVLLGALFTIFQAYEYSHAAFSFSGNIYGANFFMATGFHGFHVIVGTLFLFVCLIRASRGHFTAEQHVGFEAAAWYWHFVDVVWLFLFAGIYIWGG